MKFNNLILVFFIFIISSMSYGQGVGIGTKTPAVSAALDISSTTMGLLPPRLTTIQRNAIVNPVAGLVIYNTTTSCYDWHDGTKWNNICEFLVTGVAPGGLKWMTYNLGATGPAKSVTDYTQYGDLYQWGRGPDGHQKINWTSETSGTPVNGTTDIRSSTDYIGHNMFIKTIDGRDWRTSQNDNLWQGVSGINNPCPGNFRLPTAAEFTAEFTAQGINNLSSAYGSSLKLVGAGFRDYQGVYISSNGYYWTSSVSGSSAITRYISSGNTLSGVHNRPSGMAIRCVKD